MNDDATTHAQASPGGAAARHLPAIDAAQRRAAVDALVALHGETVRARAESGVARVAGRWQAGDGGPEAFLALCTRHFVADESTRTRLLDRLEDAVEQIRGHLYEMRRRLRRWSDLAGEEFPGVDDVLAQFDPAPDLSDQLYRQRIAFVALLNFERPDLATMLREGDAWTPQQWAAARIAQQFGPRIPAALADRARAVHHEASQFVAKFHVPVGTMVDRRGRRWFEADRALLAHWLVREEIKAGYGDPEGVDKQRALMWVMARHIDGTIPSAVMERRSHADWDPQANTVGGAPATELVGPERYRHLLAQRALAVEYDAHYPEAPTAIARKFDLAREISEQETERLLVELLDSPVRARLAALLRTRIGRALEPQDIYFEDFGAVRPAAELNAAVRARYPDEKALERGLPELLRGLGFPADEAQFLGSRIRVEIARGSGHAMRPELPEYGAWLRTGRLKEELGWDGFDTAMHELGHNLEQLYSTFRAPRPALRGVPNTACTEAFAFLYQGLARRVLGLEDAAERAQSEAIDAVATMQAACQIAGPSLVELRMWRWLYEHPSATPQELRDATLAIAREVWTRWFEPHFGADPYHILAAYQHMVGHPLYLADYTLGHIISHQIRAAMRGKDLAQETQRICSLGRLTPDLWMRRAVGRGITVEPLAADCDAALTRLGVPAGGAR
ncbi:MAG: hypothetical protein U0625_05745 [Phycisphaerales bacterium]